MKLDRLITDNRTILFLIIVLIGLIYLEINVPNNQPNDKIVIGGAVDTMTDNFSIKLGAIVQFNDSTYECNEPSNQGLRQTARINN